MNGHVTFSQLGQWGRLGNCIFEAAFLYCYAKQHGLIAQAPRFRGQEIFDFEFPQVSVGLPPRNERKKNSCEPFPPDGTEYVNHDIYGYCQQHTSWFAQWKEELQRMFRPRGAEDSKPGITKIGMHFRFGDYYNENHAWRAPTAWYRKWLEENASRFESPLIVIASEDRERAAEVAGIVIPSGIASVIATGSPADDWTALYNCDVLLTPNSTFAYTAAWLNQRLKEAWRASLPEGRFIKFNPWDSPPLLPDRAQEYTHLLDPIASPGKTKQINMTLCCCTYRRPRQLSWILAQVLRQKYHDWKMVILDDAGMYHDAPDFDPRIKIISNSVRYLNLSAKRNACAAAAIREWPDTEAFVVIDDDDVYLPRHLSDAAEALSAGDWSLPSRVLLPSQDWSALRQHHTGPGAFFHGGMAFRRDAFEKAGGYEDGWNNGEDQTLFRRLVATGAKAIDPLADGRPPTYVWTGQLLQSIPHISSMPQRDIMGQEAWNELSKFPGKPFELCIEVPPHINLESPQIQNVVLPRPFRSMATH